MAVVVNREDLWHSTHTPHTAHEPCTHMQCTHTAHTHTQSAHTEHTHAHAHIHTTLPAHTSIHTTHTSTHTHKTHTHTNTPASHESTLFVNPMVRKYFVITCKVGSLRLCSTHSGNSLSTLRAWPTAVCTAISTASVIYLTFVPETKS